MITLAQETTTLAEGATVSVVRGHSVKSVMVGTYLVAARGKDEVRMRVDDVAPGSLRTYLDLLIKWIQSERAKLTVKPDIPVAAPNNLKDFVVNMAHAGMFVFETLSDADTQGNTRISKTRKPVSRKSQRKNHPSHTG